MVEFESFHKTPRWSKTFIRVTEKIDGTNAQVYVPADPAEPVLAGSRNRWITPESDNYGFAAFVYDHAEMFRRLGPGRHFGEWWGAGIQRRYGLEERRFSLFNVGRWGAAGENLPEGLPANVGVVPLLYEGPIDAAKVDLVHGHLMEHGSVAAPGWMKPEGVVISMGDLRWKITDLAPGSKVA